MPIAITNDAIKGAMVPAVGGNWDTERQMVIMTRVIAVLH
jgi:hypothetical protein